MLPDDVEQAVRESKFNSAEADVEEVIARALQVPRALVIRVKAAYELAEDACLALVPAVANELDDSLRVALSSAVRRGLMRMKIRTFIRDEEVAHVPIKKLVKQAEHTCRGCPHSIRCAAENFSTAADCHDEGPIIQVQDSDPYGRRLIRLAKAAAIVRPTAIRGDRVTVECAHPLGDYVLDVEDFLP